MMGTAWLNKSSQRKHSFGHAWVNVEKKPSSCWQDFKNQTVSDGKINIYWP